MVVVTTILLLCMQDIVASFVLAGGHAVSGTLLIIFSNSRNWSDYSYDPYTVRFIMTAMTASGVSLFVLGL